MNSKAKAWAAAIVGFIGAYLIVVGFQNERFNYKDVIELAGRKAGSLANATAQLKQIRARSSDDDLKIAAEYLATVYTTALNHGYKDLSEIKSAGMWSAFLQGGMNAILNPIGSVKAIANTVWLETNESRFKQAGLRLDNRYGGINFLPLITAALVAWIGYAINLPEKRTV